MTRPTAPKARSVSFVASVIRAEGAPKHLVVQLASEATMKMVGAMPWASRQAATDISTRVAHTKLKSLDWFIARISGVMTAQNAGLVLRWAMIAGARHHNWVRDRLTRAAESHGWRLVRLVEMRNEVVATWVTGGRTYVVRQSADPDEIGKLIVDWRAWVPRERFLGESRIVDGMVVYCATLHPATTPTPAMIANPDLFPLDSPE